MGTPEFFTLQPARHEAHRRFSARWLGPKEIRVSANPQARGPMTTGYQWPAKWVNFVDCTAFCRTAGL